MGQLTKLKELFFPPNFKEISKANKKYLTHFSFADPQDKESVNIWNAGNIRFFINEALRRGNCFTLYYNLKLFNTEDLWDETHFENVCQWVYLTLNKPLLEKELQKTKQFDKNRLSHLKETISAYPQPYLNLEDNAKDAYFKTCLKKLNSLSDSECFNKVVTIDKENRIEILQNINDRLYDISSQNLNSTYKKSVPKDRTSEIEGDPEENSNHSENKKKQTGDFSPFSRLLIGDPERAKKMLIEELRTQGIQFDFFKKRSGYNPEREQNLPKFNGKCPAFIQFLTTNGFIKNDESWRYNLKLYFKETENYIDQKKLTEGHLRDDKIYLGAKRTLNQIDVRVLKSKIQSH